MKILLNIAILLNALLFACEQKDTVSLDRQKIRFYEIAKGDCPEKIGEKIEVINGISLRGVKIRRDSAELLTVVSRSGREFWMKPENAKIQVLGFVDANSLLTDLRNGELSELSRNYSAFNSIFGPRSEPRFIVLGDILVISSAANRTDDFILIVSLLDDSFVWLNSNSQLDVDGDYVIGCDLGL